MITASGLQHAYGGTPALQDVDLHAPDGAVTGLIGPNGSGKTTLLRLLYGVLRPAGGSVAVDGHALADLRPRDIASRMAVVVQEAPGDLPLTVAETVLLGRSPHLSDFQRPDRDDHRIAAAALRRVGVRPLADRTFASLSGGERQRVLIARALAQQADHLLLDEPTNHLDIRYQHEILDLITRLGGTTVIVLHDLNLAARYCDHVVLLDRGRVAASGAPENVLSPEVLQPVYGIGVRRTTFDGELQLLFRPLRTSDRRELASDATG
ncbi:ABC transporter ATP-binding protein [Euzebya sp.]|uniref:ABC transporter ATP-binding protein n=1 Tax=Euzebya sp. TaxID=1971409 RepID=UPI003518D775